MATPSCPPGGVAPIAAPGQSPWRRAAATGPVLGRTLRVRAAVTRPAILVPLRPAVRSVTAQCTRPGDVTGANAGPEAGRFGHAIVKRRAPPAPGRGGGAPPRGEEGRAAPGGGGGGA